MTRKFRFKHEPDSGWDVLEDGTVLFVDEDEITQSAFTTVEMLEGFCASPTDPLQEV